MVAKTRPAEQPEAPFSDWKLAFILATFLLLARAAYIAFVSPYALGPDEAQYWHWSLHPDWSYVTKPPLTTLLAGLSTQILGQTEFAVRFFALIAQTATLLVGFGLARQLGGTHQRASGWWAFALLAATPFTAFASLFMAPDSILVPLYLGGLLLLVLESRHSTQTPKHWLAMGVLVGLAGLAKYSAVFFYPLAGLYALVWRRSWLTGRWFYISGLVALALQAPVIYWNLHNGLEGLQHVAWQANAHDARHGNPLTVLNFLLGQAGIFGPVVFALMVAAATAAATGLARLPAAHRLLFIFIVPLFALFTLENFISKVQPNWPILSTIPALLLLAAWLPEQNRFIKKTAGGGIILNALLTLILSNVLFFGMPTLIKPLRDMLGVREVGNMTRYMLAKLEPGTLLAASNYGSVARLAFYVPGMKADTMYIKPEGERATQYDLWPWPSLKGKMVLYVAEGKSRDVPTTVLKKFQSCTYVTGTEIKNSGKSLRQAAYYLCAGARS
ncbi:MAG TPA: glycosyltransferase family 39 protein [Alphaproteobacteria bacterium]|nr:glycosyltransferase family 39 protein [Alphaproteobacteria bacterium]